MLILKSLKVHPMTEGWNFTNNSFSSFRSGAPKLNFWSREALGFYSGITAGRWVGTERHRRGPSSQGLPGGSTFNFDLLQGQKWIPPPPPERNYWWDNFCWKEKMLGKEKILWEHFLFSLCIRVAREREVHECEHGHLGTSAVNSEAADHLFT